MFQNGQRVCFKSGGDPARIQMVQLAYGKDRFRAPQVVPSNDPNATQVQIVTGEDAARYPFIDPIGLIGAPAAWFRADTGVTVTGQGASTVADQSGNGRDLLQSTDASRPPYLSYSGTKYLYLPGVAGNYASTPDSAANSITGDIDIQVKVALADYTPATDVRLVSKRGVSTAYDFYIDGTVTPGTLRFDNGATTTASSVANGTTDGATTWFRITRSASATEIKFFTSADGSAWTQLGTTQTIPNVALNDTTDAIGVGAGSTGSAGTVCTGSIYRAIIKNGIDGTTVVDFNPNLDASDGSTSFASSATGETWTVNSSGGLPAQIVGRNSLLFDGTADFLATAAASITLGTTATIYHAFKAVSWTLNDTIFASTLDDCNVSQQTATPKIGQYAGANANATSTLAVGTYGILCSVFNGAGSLQQVNLVAPTTGGNPGATSGTQFAVGATVAGTNHANIQSLELLLFNSQTHDATQRARIIQYLGGRHGIAL